MKLWESAQHFQNRLWLNQPPWQNLSDWICVCCRVNQGHQWQSYCTTWTAASKSLLKCQSQLDANEKMSFPSGTFHTTVVFVLPQQLPVVTSSTIVRCRSCRTYINPFVSFLDQRRWKCNLCYRVNDGRKGGRNDEKNNSFHFHIDFIKITFSKKCLLTNV